MGTMLSRGHGARRGFGGGRRRDGDGTEANESSRQELHDPVCVNAPALGCCNPRGPTEPGCSPLRMVLQGRGL